MTVSGLRMGAKLWDASVDEMPRMTSHSRWLLNAAADQIERLTEALEVAKVGFEQIEPASTVTDAVKRAADRQGKS